MHVLPVSVPIKPVKIIFAVLRMVGMMNGLKMPYAKNIVRMLRTRINACHALNFCPSFLILIAP